MLKPKYAIIPGYVYSQSDGQRHWVGFTQLCNCWKVNPRECVEIGPSLSLPEGLIPLCPMEDGNYSMPKQAEKEGGGMSVNIYYVPTIYDAPPKRFQASFRVVLAEDYAALEAKLLEVTDALSVAEGLRENAEKNQGYAEFKQQQAEKQLAELQAKLSAHSDVAVKLAELIEDAVNSLRVDGHFDLPDQLESALAAFREKQGRVS